MIIVGKIPPSSTEFAFQERDHKQSRIQIIQN